MLRVLHIISSTIFAGGEHQMLELARGLRPLGYTVELLVFYRQQRGLPSAHPMVDVARRAGFQTDQQPDPSRLSPRMFLTLLSRLASTSYDLVHTHGYKANILGTVAAWLAGVPYVATVHLHTRDTAWLRLYQRLDLWVLRRLPRVIAVSHYLRGELIEAGLGPARVVAVHNAIDLDAFVARARAPLLLDMSDDQDGPIITCIARLTPQKGHADLLAAAPAVLARWPSACFWMIGEGFLRPELEAQAVRLGVAPAVRFLGYRDDVPLLVGTSDIVVLPSRREGFGLVLLEALALSKPVVATAVGGVPEVIRDGETGWLVPPAQPQALARAIIEVLDDRDRAARVAAAGQADVRHRFSVEVMARQTAEVYAQVLGNWSG